ncbi:c-type cytochrome biogenesis protein CcmI [Phenylobacterium sp.]|uniref:c-type cytochrome biogenesis protein CcmI n=1 Tax=Phenylobacterium sp. TaxID=1871053 RepID=UPI003982FF1D
MFLFWVVAGVISAAAAGLTLFRAARAASAVEAADPTPILYRRQLAEIDDLADRGLLGEAERKSAHAEAGRRLLGAADAPVEAWTAEAAGRRPVLAAVVAAPALALGLYLALGSPGLADQPYAPRLAAWRGGDLATLKPAEIAAVLRQVVKERPGDPEGLRLLALAEGASENPPAAVRALRRAVAMAPERTDLWRLLAEAIVYRDGGEVKPEAAQVFAEVLRREPGDVTARFYRAQGKQAAGAKAEAAADLRALLADVPASDERRGAVEAALALAEGKATVASVSDEQLTAIRGMVAGLAQRLDASPDDPEGWVRLVRAYSVLGETAQRDAALRAAQARYAGQAEILDQLAQAARTEPMR